MLQFLLRKLGYASGVLIGVVILIFILFQGFGDPARMVAGQTGDIQTLNNIRRDLNLDQPRWKQFLLYLNDVSPVSVYDAQTRQQRGIQGLFAGGSWEIGIKWPYLRTSYQTRKPVSETLLEALPGTLLLAVSAMLFATLLGILLGSIAAFNKHRWPDKLIQVTAVAGISSPSFFMAMLIAYLFGLILHDYTGLYMTGNWYDIDEHSGRRILSIHNLILPAFTLGIRPLAIITQLTRSSLLDVLQQDFIRTAKAKGLNNRQIIFRHALRNSLNPVVTAITGWFAELLAGAFFVEYIFGWKGIGKITVDALEKLDYPMVMGAVLVSAAIFVLMNIFADLLYTKIDPRIRLQ